MAFLDNSGDIILDAVLTDHGRMVLAKGDGSFQITKFALGDEENNLRKEMVAFKFQNLHLVMRKLIIVFTMLTILVVVRIMI